MKTLGDIKRVLLQRDLLKEVSGEAENRLLLMRLTCDSREVTEKTLFICKGAAFRPQYLLDAVKKGAVAYISETKMEVPVPGLIVKDIRKAMAAASAWFWDYKVGHPTLTGITGTKGKTTTAWYLKKRTGDRTDLDGGKL